MSDIKTEAVYAGMTTKGIGGIDGDFMRENDLVLAVVVTMDGEAAIMLHPQFNFERVTQLVHMLDTVHGQAVEVLSGKVGVNGQVH